MSEHTPDVTVVGAGIVGICCTLSLLERGKSVRLVDKTGPMAGASYGNAGVISPWSCVPHSLPGMWRNIPGWLLDPLGPLSIRPAYLPRFLPWAIKFLRNGQPHRVAAIADGMSTLIQHNVELYRGHLAGTGQEHLLRDSSYVFAYRNREKIDLDQIGFRLRREHGATMEVIDAAELRELEPDLSPDYQGAVVIKDQARAMSPGLIGEALAEKARVAGADIHTAAVNSITPREDGSWSLETDRGALDSTAIVIAAGPWSTELLAPLGLRLPLEYERGYHLEFLDPGVTLNNSVMDVEQTFVTSSMANGVRSAGTAEFAGLDTPPNFRRAQVLKQLTKTMLPALNTGNANEWMGIRPSFPDSLPCIDTAPGFRNLYTAFGHSHYGLGMAPQTGRFVADIVSGIAPNADLTPYRVSRFL